MIESLDQVRGMVLGYAIAKDPSRMLDATGCSTLREYYKLSADASGHYSAQSIKNLRDEFAPFISESEIVGYTMHGELKPTRKTVFDICERLSIERLVAAVVEITSLRESDETRELLTSCLTYS